MFISGLWHGTGLTFIVWGIYYGVLIIAYQFIAIRGEWKSTDKFAQFFAWLIMFSFIIFGWIIFRSQSIAWLRNALFFMPFYQNKEELIASFVLLSMIGFYTSLLIIKYVIEKYYPRQISLHGLYYTVAALFTAIYANSSSPDFIYFQF